MKQDLTKLQHELDRIYHLATLTGRLRTESDFESDLVQSEVESRIECAFMDLKYDLKTKYPILSRFGQVYQYGRGGRTVCFEGLTQSFGYSRFKIKDAEELIDSGDDQDFIDAFADELKKFNDSVKSFCEWVSDDSIEFIREEYAKEIKQNKAKRRVTRRVVSYE